MLMQGLMVHVGGRSKQAVSIFGGRSKQAVQMLKAFC